MGNSIVNWNTDLASDKKSQRAFKRPLVHDVVFANAAGVCETLEGPAPYLSGDAIVTGVAGEHWPVPREYFLATYEAVTPTEPGYDGRYRKKKILVWVLQLETSTSVSVAGNTAKLTGCAGDWLVQYEPGSWGIVEQNIFQQTYLLDE